MNKLFSFNWQTNYLFIPLAMAISFDLRYLATKALSSEAKNGFLNTIVMFSGQMLNGSFEFCCSYKNKVFTNINKVPLFNNSFIRYDRILVFIAASLDLISFTMLNYLIDEKNNIGELSLILRMSQTIFMAPLVKLIVGTQIHRHTIVSIIIIALSLIGLILFEAQIKYIPNILLYILSYIINSLRIVVMKKTMEKYFYSAYKELFYVGLTGNIEMLVIISILSIFRDSTISFTSVFCSPITAMIGSPINFIYFISIFFTGSLFNTFGTTTNDLLSSLHVGIGDTLAGMIFLCYQPFDIDFLFNCIFIGIILLCCLICTEIIICNFCGMQGNTVKAIAERAISEENIEVNEELLTDDG